MILKSFHWKREELLSKAGTENARKVSELTFSIGNKALIERETYKLTILLITWLEKSKSYLQTHLILLCITQIFPVWFCKIFGQTSRVVENLT